MDTHEVSEVLWAYLCSVGYAGANTNIWHEHHAYSQWTHMKFFNYCGRICVMLDMLVLIPIFCNNTMRIPSHEVSKKLRAYLCSFKHVGVKTIILQIVILV